MTLEELQALVTRAGEVWTSDGRFCLAGITRANVLEVCRRDGLPARETTFSLTDVYNAAEAFVTQEGFGKDVVGLPVDETVAPLQPDADTGEIVSPLAAFLTHAALEAGDGAAVAEQGDAPGLPGRRPLLQGGGAGVGQRRRGLPPSFTRACSPSSPALAWRNHTRSPTARSSAAGPRSGVCTSPAPSAPSSRSPGGYVGTGSRSGPAGPEATQPPPATVTSPGPGRRVTASAKSAAGAGSKES